MSASFESDVFESGTECIVPMEWAAAQTIESFVEKPQVPGFAKRAAGRWFYNHNFFGREESMKEGVLAIALLLDPTFFNGKGSEKAGAGFLEDGSVSFTPFPRGGFVVP
jgi:hypothetical protein